MFLFLSPSTFFGLPLVQFLFFSLSLSLSCSFLSFFLLVFLCLLSFGSFFFSLSHFSFFFAFVFWKEQHEILKLQFICSSIFSLFMVSCLVSLFQIPFSYLCFFSWYSVMLFVEHQYFWFQKRSWKTPILGQKGSCNKTGFFNNLCFEKCEKLSFFPFFGPNFGWCSKSTVKIGISAYFQKKKRKKWPFCRVTIWAKLGLLSGPSLLQHQNGQLGPDNNPANFCAHFLSKKTKSAETPIL